MSYLFEFRACHWSFYFTKNPSIDSLTFDLKDIEIVGNPYEYCEEGSPVFIYVFPTRCVAFFDQSEAERQAFCEHFTVNSVECCVVPLKYVNFMESDFELNAAKFAKLFGKGIDRNKFISEYSCCDSFNFQTIMQHKYKYVISKHNIYHLLPVFVECCKHVSMDVLMILCEFCDVCATEFHLTNYDFML